MATSDSIFYWLVRKQQIRLADIKRLMINQSMTSNTLIVCLLFNQSIKNSLFTCTFLRSLTKFKKKSNIKIEKSFEGKSIMFPYFKLITLYIHYLLFKKHFKSIMCSVSWVLGLREFSIDKTLIEGKLLWTDESFKTYWFDETFKV